MPIWEVSSIDIEPETKLTWWSIREVALVGEPGMTRHFVGEVAQWHPEGRVSSPIVEFDPVKMRGITRSGRVYQLIGPTGSTKESDYVWAWWCAINHVVDFKYVNLNNEKTESI